MQRNGNRLEKRCAEGKKKKKTKPFVFGAQDAWEEFWIAKKNVSKRRWRATTAQPNHPRWFRALGANLQHTWQPVKKPAKSYFDSFCRFFHKFFCRSAQVFSQVAKCAAGSPNVLQTIWGGLVGTNI